MLSAFALATILAPAPPAQLSTTTFDQVRAYVRPTAEDELYLSLPWQRSVFDGIQLARQVDRPILMWMYFGDPQGQC